MDLSPWGRVAPNLGDAWVRVLGRSSGLPVVGMRHYQSYASFLYLKKLCSDILLSGFRCVGIFSTNRARNCANYRSFCIFILKKINPRNQRLSMTPAALMVIFALFSPFVYSSSETEEIQAEQKEISSLFNYDDALDPGDDSLAYDPGGICTEPGQGCES
jgi:hypothetical protein